MPSRSSRPRIRRAPTAPNSPREIMLGEVAPNGPIQSEIASKSNVRQTVAFVFVMLSTPEADGTTATVEPTPRGVAWEAGGAAGEVGRHAGGRVCFRHVAHSGS